MGEIELAAVRPCRGVTRKTARGVEGRKPVAQRVLQRPLGRLGVPGRQPKMTRREAADLRFVEGAVFLEQIRLPVPPRAKSPLDSGLKRLTPGFHLHGVAGIPRQRRVEIGPNKGVRVGSALETARSGLARLLSTGAMERGMGHRVPRIRSEEGRMAFCTSAIAHKAVGSLRALGGPPSFAGKVVFRCCRGELGDLCPDLDDLGLDDLGPDLGDLCLDDLGPDLGDLCLELHRRRQKPGDGQRSAQYADSPGAKPPRTPHTDRVSSSGAPMLKSEGHLRDNGRLQRREGLFLLSSSVSRAAAVRVDTANRGEQAFMVKRFGIGSICVAATICSLALLGSGKAQQPALTTPPNVAAMPFMNPSLPVDQRVEDLLKRMTLDEKASQLVNQSRAIPRLGVPAYDWWSEALHGVASGTATVFPEPIGLAASFDPPAIHEMGTIIGVEGRAKYNMALRAGERKIFEGITFWSPNINIFRDPRWGRGQETYGEDPFLTGKMGVAFVTGLQGDDPKYMQVVATPKHYAVHSGPEPTRHTVDVTVSKHDIEDTYLPAFRAAVVEGKAASVMCVYNSLNGQPGCANDFLLKDTLRGKWGFKGYVVSDCDAVADIQRGHHFVKTMAEAAAVSMKAGTDNDCADFFAVKTDNSDYVRYIDAVKQGFMTEADVDVSMRRLLRARFNLGMFDPPAMVKYAQTPDSENDSEAHRQVALKLARETMVLLKNDGVLPLSPSVKKILVVGPLADQTRVLEGNYHGTASRYVTALDGIKKQFPNAEVTFEPGTSFLRNPGPVPANVLTHGSNEAGLQADFFSSAELTGAPVATRVDAQVNYDRHTANNLPAGATKGFVRWTGFLTPTESGTYRLGVNGLMDRLTFDNKVLIDDMTAHPSGQQDGDGTARSWSCVPSQAGVHGRAGRKRAAHLGQGSRERAGACGPGRETVRCRDRCRRHHLGS